MRKTLLCSLLALPMIVRAAEPPNPAIDFQRFAQLTQELAPVREASRIGEDEFLKMAAEPGTVILDARSTDRFERLHVKGAIHLAFTDFTAEALAKLIPDKATRILIYCNNNFDKEPVDFARKQVSVALNVQTFINLHAYGYRNVKELAPLLDRTTTKIPFDGTTVKK